MALDVSKLLEEIRTSPYDEIVIKAPNCGVINFCNIQKGDKVVGPSGTWKEKPGNRMAKLTRENNQQYIESIEKGEIKTIHTELEGSFVEAGTTLLTLRHYLSKDEVLKIILKNALYLFKAPERAKYYFTPETDLKIKASGHKGVIVSEGIELLIMSRMKREIPLCYSGPEGVIYAVYFKHYSTVDANMPLLGICPPEQLQTIEDVVIRVQTEWEEID